MSKNILQKSSDMDNGSITVVYILNLLKKGWKLMVFMAAIVAVIAFSFSKFVITPKYSSNISMYVTNTTNTSSGNINYNDIYASQKLADTYIVVLEDPSVFEQVCNKLHTSMTVGQLRKVVSFNSVNETEVIKITAVTSDPELSAEICNTYGDIAPEVLQRVFKAGSVEIIGKAKVATSPSSPNLFTNSFIGAAVGVFAAFIIVVIKSLFDVTVQSEEELKEKIGVPVWASIPSFNKSRGKNNKKKRDFSEIRKGLLGPKTPFTIKEAYKAARTSMSFAVNNGAVKTVVVSSCEPDAGKSTTCANLAITMSKMNARVLIVDADLRKPIQHKYFRIDNSKGLSGVLAGHYPVSECIYEVANNLYVMPSGVIPPNPSELLASANMDRLIREISSVYDYVFFDAPPAGVVTDAVILTPKTDGMLFIVRQNQTEYPEIRKIFDDVGHTEGKVIGIIITDVSNYNSFGTVKYKAYDYKYTESTERTMSRPEKKKTPQNPV